MKKRTSPLARALAAIALVGAVVVVIAVVSSSLGGDSGSSPQHHGSGHAAKQQGGQRPQADSYVVQSGDTLTAIAHKTGVTVAHILALNPEVDPQILIAGETLKLR